MNSNIKIAKSGTRLLILVPYLWLIIFFAMPGLIILRISLSQSVIAQPPYMPMLDLAAGWSRHCGISPRSVVLQLCRMLIADTLYVASYIKSVQVALISTAILFVVGYPIAYAISRLSPRWQTVGVLLVILPFWTSFLIRVYAWITILSMTVF